MDRDARAERAEALREELEAAAVDRSLRDLAAEIGVSHGTVANVLDGRVPSERTLRRLERWTAGEGAAHASMLPPSLVDSYDDAPAERLLAHLKASPEMRRLVAELGPERVVKAAYAVALEEGWAEAELKKLDRWRKQVLSAETSS